jgi:hypothetical protein
MPNQLTPRITVVLVSLVFSVAFGVQALSRSSAPKAAVGMHSGLAAEHPGPRPHVSLSVARSVPALRDPRKPHMRKPKTKPKKSNVGLAARRPAPVRVVSSHPPTATATPRYVPTPTPRYVPPKPRPRATPAPTSPPAPSGNFDTSGSFDSSGTP